MKEESCTDVSVRSRKRKANVAVVSTKETGGGGLPLILPGYQAGLCPHVLMEGYVEGWSGLQKLPYPNQFAHFLTNFLFLLSFVFLSLGCLVCFLGDGFMLVFARS